MGFEVIQGDCLEVMRGMADGVVYVVTDPPWGMAANSKRRLHAYKDPAKSGGKIGWSNWADATEYGDTRWDDTPLTPEQWAEMRRVSVEQIVFGANHLHAVLGKPNSTLVWDKKCRNGWRDSFSDCELIWCSITQPDRMFRHAWMGAIRAGKRERRVHPSQKPVELMDWCLSFLPAGCTVLDPFAGSGSTGIACVNTGRNFIGIEREPEYVETARRRIAGVSLSTPLFAGAVA